MNAFPEVPLRITHDMLLSRRVDLERRMGRVPPVTLAILALLVAIFVLEVRAGALDSRESILAMGALARAHVRAGEYWRLLTAPWLHGSTEHLVDMRQLCDTHVELERLIRAAADEKQ